MSSRRERAAQIRHLIETEGDAIYDNATHFNDVRLEAVDGFDRLEELRSEARTLKEDAIDRLPELIEQLREAVQANGGNLYLADDAEDANAYVESVCADHDAESVVKSKSMTTEEIDLNEHLEAAGVDVYETDLGEFVVQIADEAPSHLVGPAMHKSTEEIAELFTEVFEPDEPLETAEQLTTFARDYLGEKIRDADVGVTGANFVLAESGTIVLVTNEGNARKSAVTPPVHIAVAGIEKVIPSIEELSPFAELIARIAVGESLPRYLTLLSPPTDSPMLDFDADEPIGPGDREFHLVLIDNGREAMREDDQLRETLYCIRCGACANSCANFQHVGGHAFGGETYTGGIATGWEAGVEGLEAAGEFNDLCTGCTRCVNACPVKIDIPWINTVVRDRINHGADPGAFDPLVEGLTPDAEPGAMDLQKRFFGNVETLARWGSATAPVSNWLARRGPVRWVLDRAVGVDPDRTLPAFKRETLRDWQADRRATVSAPDRAVTLYADLYTNHVRVDRGKAAIRVLEALGFEVHLTAALETGRAPLSQGMIATATDRAEAVSETLQPHLEAGRDVVVVEPSDLAMLRSDYAKLLDDDVHRRIAERSYEIGEYVAGQLGNGADGDALANGNGVSVAYHSHCQQRTLELEAPTVALLEARGFDVETSSVECCGMAGSFGYKSQYAELSRDVGEPLAEAFAGHAGPLAASGTSCAEQLESLLGGEAVHPVELLDPGAG